MGQELTVVQEVRQTLDRMQPELRAVLPAHIEPAAFIRVSQTAINSNPDLQRCSPRSLIAACTKGAEIGLPPDGEYAAIIAFGNVAKFMPMIAGLRDLVRRSGQVKDWKARVVFEGDEFDYIDGDEERLVHKPAFIPGAAPRLVYSIAYLENGEISRNVMRMDEIDAIRRRSRTSGSGPWMTDYLQMALKTCMRRHYKALPRAKDDLVRQRLTSAIHVMDENDGAIDIPVEAPALPAPALSMHEAARRRMNEAVELSALDTPAEREQAPIAETPAPKPARKRKTVDERLAEANAGKEGNGRPAPNAGTEDRTKSQTHASQAQSTSLPSSATAEQPSADDGRDLAYEAEQRENPEPEFGRETAEQDEPEIEAFRDGWRSRSAGKTRFPPRTITKGDIAQAWIAGYDAFQKTVDIGNAPKTVDASEAMLSRMIDRQFA